MWNLEKGLRKSRRWWWWRSGNQDDDSCNLMINAVRLFELKFGCNMEVVNWFKIQDDDNRDVAMVVADMVGGGGGSWPGEVMETHHALTDLLFLTFLLSSRTDFFNVFRHHSLTDLILTFFLSSRTDWFLTFFFKIFFLLFHFF